MRTVMWRAGRNSEPAFTLLEALVVLVVLSLVGTAVALNLSSARERIRYTQAGSWLESAVSHWREQARREGRTIFVEFDPAAGRYRISGDEWRVLPPGVTWTIETAGQPGARNARLVFLPDGTGPGATITIRTGTYSSLYQIEQLTGTLRHARS